jgi:multiple sugar transport system ATP-binding protein
MDGGKQSAGELAALGEEQSMARIELSGISKSFGSAGVLSGINLSIGDGEFLTLVGPSGCGKSTLIRIIAGLETQTQGSVRVDGAPIDHLRPHERGVAMVFQNYALYPHMTVAENIALPLVMARLPLRERLPPLNWLSRRRRRVLREIGAEVEAAAALLRIEELLLRRPSQLSGGQRQRVALGRAMVRKPIAFLMDEPLSNLDAKLRVHMRAELSDLHRRLGTTFIYVTHDQVEAMTMSDRVAVMGRGSVLQLGTPDELYRFPANVEVAQFIGNPTINILPVTVTAGGLISLYGRPLPIRSSLPAGSSASLGLRPDDISLASARGGATLAARLVRSEHLGPEKILHLQLFDDDRATLTCRVPAAVLVPEGNEVQLSFDPRVAHLFDSEGNRSEWAEAGTDESDRRAPARLYGSEVSYGPV